MADISVKELNFTVRASNALQRMEINTLEQLLNTPLSKIIDEKSLGVKAVAEITEFIEKYRNGEIDANLLHDNVNASKAKEYDLSEDEIELMSMHSIQELGLPNRAMNKLMQIGCDTVSKLAQIPEKEIREMKGLGSKSSNEIIGALDSWLEQNILIGREERKADIIPDFERNYYVNLADILSPIKKINWQKLRGLMNDTNLAFLIQHGDIDVVNSGLIEQALGLDEFKEPIRTIFLSMAKKGVIPVSELKEKVEALKLEFDGDILYERLIDGSICRIDAENCFVIRPSVEEYLETHEKDFDNRNFNVLAKRLKGESLQEIGAMFGLTRERVRQILKKTVQSIPDLNEDFYREPYEYFKFTKEEFARAFPKCGEIGYEYLFIKYKKGNEPIGSSNLSDYTGLFKEELNCYWKNELLRMDKEHVTKTEMVYRVLLSNSDESLSMEEFEEEYNAYVGRRNYPQDRLAINVRTVTNYLRTAPHIVFDKNNRVRYCDADSSVVWNSVDFKQYEDTVISSELIYRDYYDLMSDLDIRDGYELFYVIKSSIEQNHSGFDISCRRVPVMIIGKGDEAKQALQLLKEISPVDFYGYYEAYEERFGVRSASGNPVITEALAAYYLDGEYSVDVTAIEDQDAAALQAALSKKKFWFNDEVEKIFHDICVHSSEDALNKAAFKRIGYSLNIGYTYNDNYGTVVNYFDQEIFTRPILDLNNYDRRLLGLSAFGSALYKKRMELEYIEVAPKVFMQKAELERVYGIDRLYIDALQDWANQYEDKYFNAHSVWKNLCVAGLDVKLQGNEWLCTCIFRQQPTVFSQQVAGGIILCKDSSELNLGSVCQWLVEKYGKMTVQTLTTTFNDTFATRIPASKIAEKLRAYGLWDVVVTDSFDEYIDNLVVLTESNLDANDLLQEEFF